MSKRERSVMRSPSADDEVERIIREEHEKIRREIEESRRLGKYRYYNDDRSLLRVGERERSEQFAPKTAGWKPGGYPSYRAARLTYEGAYDLAYRLVNSFGDPKDLEGLDIGPESWFDEPDREDSE